MSEDCEKCAQEEQMSKIAQSIENQKISCSRCSTKISDEKREFSKEEVNTILNKLEKEDFKIWYQIIAGWSKQLREALLSSENFVSKMLDVHKELKHLDMKKDNGRVINKLQDMLNLAQMTETNSKLIIKTLEMIEGKVHGNG